MSDTYVRSAVSHPADAFPSVLAIAEAEALGGDDLLLATAIAYEVQCRFVEVVPYNHHKFNALTRECLGAKARKAIVDRVSRLEREHALRDLIALTRITETV
jgi:2-methylcitrate dehydratase PrpD